MKVLVTGGRTFGVAQNAMLLPERIAEASRERDVLTRALDAFHARHGVAALIHGAAIGADTHAARWASVAGLEVCLYPADWPGLGRKAGPIRNSQMLREGKPDAVLAFPGGRGTEGMVALALKAGVPVWRVLDGRMERA